jgi:hypothetical protein
MLNQCKSTILSNVLNDFVIPFLVGVTSYILIAKLDDWKNRKKHSRLGVAIIGSLIEEVKTGITILNQFQATNELPLTFIPTKSWSGNATVNDDILLRIIKVDKDVKHKHFPPSEILIHCKNYFEMMATQWNNNIILLEKNTPPEIVIGQAKGMLQHGNFLIAAQGVLAMLETTVKLLKANSQKTFPC